ncbi:MAG: hypothetical protein HY520_00240 [Candidatus Aenigmarchaeota archaeon]|nr:hypothetical protein [Candidatus Aenigmarchaeota archaeon]
MNTSKKRSPRGPPRYLGVVQGSAFGPRGPYGIAFVQGLEGSVTFPLRGRRCPEPSTIIVVWDLERRAKGWCANRWRRVRPSDSNQQS